MSDGAPPQNRDAARGLLPIHQEVGYVVRNVLGAFDGRFVNTFLDDEFLEWCVRHDGLRNDSLLPRNRFSIRTQAGTDGVIRPWPIPTAADVVFTCPHDFEWRLDCLGDLHRLNNEMAVRHRAASEAASAKHSVQLHLL